MAEVLFDDDDEDDFWIDDPYAEADDLAEHTMQSPVLINYDPAIELEESWTDWEYYSDDFFDIEEPRRKRRKVDKTGNELDASTMKNNQQNLKSTEKLPGLSLGEAASPDEEDTFRSQATVVWKARGDSPKPPTVEAGQEEKVSILKDWKERFKPRLTQDITQATPNEGRQRAVAVLIEKASKDNVSTSNSIVSESAKHQRRPNGKTSISSLTQRNRRQVPNSSDIGSSDTEAESFNHVIEPAPNPRKRKVSRSSEAAPETVLVNSLPQKKRARASDKNIPERDSANRGVDRVKNPQKRKSSHSPESPPEPILANGLPHRKRARASLEDLDSTSMAKPKTGPAPSNALNHKRHQATSTLESRGVIKKAIDHTTRKKESLDQRTETEPIGSKRKIRSTQGEFEPKAKRTKSKPAVEKAAAAKDENTRPKAAAVGRRSTRRK
ncbi:MAG: hypothetical protein Q9201_002033 [Fulgogasparrea decipioides]